MERRMLLAVVLSFVCVTLYSAITGQGCVPRPPEEPITEKNGEQDPSGDPPAQPGDPDPDPGQPKDPQDPKDPKDPVKPNPNDPKPEPAKFHPHAKVKGDTVRLESAELVVVFDTQGGGIRHVTLKNHADPSDGGQLDLIVPADPTFLMGQTDLTGVRPKRAPGPDVRKDLPAGPMRQYHWKRNKKLEDATPDIEDVVFEFETVQGTVVRKRWSLVSQADRYDIKLALSAHGGPEKIRMRLLAAAGQLQEPRKGMDMFGPKRAVFLATGMDEADDDKNYAHGWGLEEFQGEGLTTRGLRLLGSRSLYFITTLYGDGSADSATPLWTWINGEDASKRSEMETRLTAFFGAKKRLSKGADGEITDLGARIATSVANMQHAWATYDLQTKAGTAPLTFSWYAGPMDRETLAQAGYEPLSRTIVFPFAPDVVAQILLWIYDLFRNLFNSVGLAVICMTLCVRGLMMPLSIRNQLSMRGYSRKIAKIKPKIKALQEKYGKNPKKFREEQMKLYRENNIGFPGGCLMMIIQIPIWFALFASLRREFTIRGASFLWIGDLSGPDALVDFGTCYSFLILTICGLNLLPFLMVTLSVLHARSMPKPQDEQTAQQYKMMKWMPIIFAVILYNYTAALMLYMTLSSGFGIIESKIVRAKDEAAKEAMA